MFQHLPFLPFTKLCSHFPNFLNIISSLKSHIGHLLFVLVEFPFKQVKNDLFSSESHARQFLIKNLKLDTTHFQIST